MQPSSHPADDLSIGRVLTQLQLKGYEHGVTNYTDPAQAFVVVPFVTPLDAAEYVEKVAADFPEEPRLLVVEGRESVVIDDSGAHFELCFQGGWRVKVADTHEGVVVIAKTDASPASLSGRS